MPDVCANPNPPSTTLETPSKKSAFAPPGSVDFESSVSTITKMPDDVGAEVAEVLGHLDGTYAPVLGRSPKLDMVDLGEADLARTIFDADGTPTIQFNERYWTDKDSLDEFMALREVDAVVGQTYGDEMLRQYGHVLWGTPRVDGFALKAAPVSKLDLIDGVNADLEIQDLDELFKSTSGRLQFTNYPDDVRDHVIDSLSEQALKSPDDFFAEAFVDWTKFRSADASDFGTTLGDWLYTKVGVNPPSALDVNVGTLADKLAPLFSGSPTPSSAAAASVFNRVEGVEGTLGVDDIDQFFANPDLVMEEDDVENFWQYWTDYDTTLSAAQRNAVFEYQSGSGPFNRYLRGKSEAAERLTQDEIIEIIANLDSALQVPVGDLLDDGGIAFRGVKQSVADGWEDGAIYADPAFMSTSFSREQAEVFAEGITSEGYIMNVYLPPEARGMYVSRPDDMYSGEEYEFILPRETKFKVLYRNENTKEIYVEVIP